MDALKAAQDERLAAEQKAAAEKRAAAEEQAKKAKKQAKKLVPFLLIAVIAVIAIGMFASHRMKMQNYPVRAFCDYISKNGAYTEEVSLPLYTEDSPDTPVTFSGYEVELSHDNTSEILQLGDNTCTIWAEKDDLGTIWYRSHTDTGSDVSLDFVTRLTCTTQEKRLDYTCTVGNAVSLPDSKADIVLIGAVSPSSYHMADPVSIHDMWLKSDKLSLDDPSDYPLTEEIKESFEETVTSQTAMFLCNLNSYLQGKTDISMADFGFSDEAGAYSSNEFAVELLDMSMAQSFTTAYSQLSSTSADKDTVNEYQALIEKYLPYCGNFVEAEVKVSGKEKGTTSYTLISDFHLSEDGKVHWKVSSSDGSGNLYLTNANIKHYPFISATDDRLLVSDTMTVEYDFRTQYSVYHCKAVLQNDEIIVTLTEDTNGYVSDAAYIHYVKES